MPVELSFLDTRLPVKPLGHSYQGQETDDHQLQHGREYSSLPLLLNCERKA